jgi:hypothetical protein
LCIGDRIEKCSHGGDVFFRYEHRLHLECARYLDQRRDAKVGTVFDPRDVRIGYLERRGEFRLTQAPDPARKREEAAD